MIYNAILLNVRDEIVETRKFHSRQRAIEQCHMWQLQHEYDFYDTEIQEEEEV